MFNIGCATTPSAHSSPITVVACTAADRPPTPPGLGSRVTNRRRVLRLRRANRIQEQLTVLRDVAAYLSSTLSSAFYLSEETKHNEVNAMPAANQVYTLPIDWKASSSFTPLSGVKQNEAIVMAAGLQTTATLSVKEKVNAIEARLALAAQRLTPAVYTSSSRISTKLKNNEPTVMAAVKQVTASSSSTHLSDGMIGYCDDDSMMAAADGSEAIWNNIQDWFNEDLVTIDTATVPQDSVKEETIDKAVTTSIEEQEGIGIYHYALLLKAFIGWNNWLCSTEEIKYNEATVMAAGKQFNTLSVCTSTTPLPSSEAKNNEAIVMATTHLTTDSITNNAATVKAAVQSVSMSSVSTGWSNRLGSSEETKNNEAIAMAAVKQATQSTVCMASSSFTPLPHLGLKSNEAIVMEAEQPMTLRRLLGVGEDERIEFSLPKL